ncbi:MAG: TlpA family protein disulfide reductase [Bacteroidia bacterium]|nr:TlpA family protein disulfide reductase [Bacteroidia bacterium]
MVARIICVLITLNCLNYSIHAQCDKESIANINNEWFSRENHVIKLVYSSKTRYVSRIHEQKKLVYLGDIKNGNQNFAYIDSFSRFQYKANRDYSFYRHTDSLKFDSSKFSRPFDISKWEIPNDLFFLKYIPVTQNELFFSNNYTSGRLKNYSSSKDTFVLDQKQKKTKIHRKLFLDKDYHIFRIEYIDFNTENLQERWSIDFTIIQNNRIDEVGDSLKYGPFRSNTFNRSQIIIDSTTLDSKNPFRITLITGEVIEIDTLKEKYFVVDFWYLACKPCHYMNPELEKLYQKMDISKVLFFGYNKSDTKEDILFFNNLKRRKIPEIDKQYFSISKFDFNSIRSHPTVIIFDNKFQVIKKIVGYSKDNVSVIEEFLTEKKLFN